MPIERSPPQGGSWPTGPRRGFQSEPRPPGVLRSCAHPWTLTGNLHPVTVVSGIGAASRRGILVKGGAALEVAGRLKALAFDKTGTLTEGRPVLSRVVALDGNDETEVLRLAAALERRSEHPLAHAILSARSEERRVGKE